MKRLLRGFCGMVAMYLVSGVAFAESLTIAVRHHGYIYQLRDNFVSEFMEENPDIELNWVFFRAEELRERLRADIATNRGKYDIVVVSAYEAPIWAREGWLVSLNDLPASYDIGDIIPTVRDGLTVDGDLYAVPFDAESSMIMYRKDLMKEAGLIMPEAPTWDFIRKAAKAMTNRTNKNRNEDEDEDKEVYGICLRGKADWSENVAFLTAMANSFGGKWFDLDWDPQFDSDAWNEALNFYLDMMEESGPPTASSNGFAENLSLFQSGQCGIWIDSTAAGSLVTNWRQSEVYDQVGFALAPDKGLGKRGNWLWGWNFAIPVSSRRVEVAKKFIDWMTSKDYFALVASREERANLPTSARTSSYENLEYAKLPFAQIALDSINSADPTNPAVDPVPYVGVQFVAIPEYWSIANAVGREFSSALAGRISAEEALKNAQDLTLRIMKKTGYTRQ